MVDGQLSAGSLVDASINLRLCWTLIATNLRPPGCTLALQDDSGGSGAPSSRCLLDGGFRVRTAGDLEMLPSNRQQLPKSDSLLVPNPANSAALRPVRAGFGRVGAGDYQVKGAHLSHRKGTHLIMVRPEGDLDGCSATGRADGPGLNGRGGLYGQISPMGPAPAGRPHGGDFCVIQTRCFGFRSDEDFA